MQHYVISLAHDQQRREHITREFGKHGIAFTFLDAVTPERVPEVATMLDMHLAAQPQLTPGVQACFCSHLLAWHTAFTTSDTPCIAVFEDDILLSRSAATILEHIDTQLQQQTAFDLLRLETFLGFVPDAEMQLHTPLALPVPFASFRMRTQQDGTGGYVITRQGAQAILEYVRELAAQPGKLPPADVLIFGKYILEKLQVLQLVPAICIQQSVAIHRLHLHGEPLPGHLESDRKAIRRARRTLGRKLIDEITNPFRKYWSRRHCSCIPFADSTFSD